MTSPEDRRPIGQPTEQPERHSEQQPALEGESGHAPFGIEESPWLGSTAEAALRAVIPGFMEDTSAALYARWWQLECWLRSLAYVELRALHGTKWIDAVKAANLRLEQDAVYTHMAGPDSDNPLAYLDYSQVVELIERFWDQIGYALFEKASWQGRQVDLKRIRHRIGHMRRPHADDLGRLEQVLRDLEGGTFKALSTYNDRHVPDAALYSDAVTTGWILGEHEDARRLVAHADRQYEARIRVRVSTRTWAERSPTRIAGTPGHLWHVDFFKRGRGIDVPALWRDVESNDVGRLLVHLEAHGGHHVGFTFSAVDDDSKVADAIGSAFDYVLMNLAHGHQVDHGADWSRRMRDMDYRIVSGDGWTAVDETTVPISNFGAGGGVTKRPRG
ncbi:hypothetical protein [Nocardioides ungokensis]|uniref:hypothetical protein n=1 Tax=Nocardioides ungokensis TaxID=1643322 RepID=UPI001C60D13B|nr:hypothetical protein [Nocardioides ungokensis]